MRAISQFAFILCLFLPTHKLFAQLSPDVVVRESLMISVKKHDEMNPVYQYLVDEEARAFDIESFIADQIATAEIQISGMKTSYNKTVKIEFDSRKLEVKEGKRSFCKNIVKISKIPVFGLTVSPMDDLQGVLVETVYEGSAAELAGIQPGDMISYVSENVIQSGCDIAESLEDVEVGEVLDIFMEKNGEHLINPLIVGYKIEEVVSYNYCDHPELLETTNQSTQMSNLTIFPNPTADITQLKFRSSDKTKLNIRITDIAGQQISVSEVEDFDGFYHEVLDLSHFTSGVYFVQIQQGEKIWTEKVVLQNL